MLKRIFSNPKKFIFEKDKEILIDSLSKVFLDTNYFLLNKDEFSLTFLKTIENKGEIKIEIIFRSNIEGVNVDVYLFQRIDSLNIHYDKIMKHRKNKNLICMSFINFLNNPNGTFKINKEKGFFRVNYYDDIFKITKEIKDTFTDKIEPICFQFFNIEFVDSKFNCNTGNYENLIYNLFFSDRSIIGLLAAALNNNPKIKQYYQLYYQEALKQKEINIENYEDFMRGAEYINKITHGKLY